MAVTNAAGATSQEPAVTLTAHLGPALVVPRPDTGGPTASGRLTGELRRFVQGDAYFWPPRAVVRVTFVNLTGPPASISIRFGARGETGRVWYSFCGGTGVSRGACPPARRGAIRGEISVYGGASTLSRYDVYVEITTARNPQGELRGQIVVRR
jgi:hypothetical protein